VSKKTEADIKNRLLYLFNMKKELVKNILLLKSAFSVIDQMFQQEITNSEIKKRGWGCCWDWCWGASGGGAGKIVDPMSLNSFVNDLMDPYKDASS
jgi:hypothetical protein